MCVGFLPGQLVLDHRVMEGFWVLPNFVKFLINEFSLTPNQIIYGSPDSRFFEVRYKLNKT